MSAVMRNWRKKRLKKTIGFLMILCFLAVSNRASAATGICKVFYLSELGAGQTVSINASLNSAGYTASVTANPTVNTLTNALMGSSKILYVHTHGAPGLLKCPYDSFVAVPLLPSSGLSMAYLSACESAAVSTTYGTSSAYKLYSLGVPRVLGFAGTVYVGNGSQGLDYFDKNFFDFFLFNHYSLQYSMVCARQALYASSGSYWGTDTAVVYGGSLTYP